ncbi:aminotransferase class I/II-fold pyridoxal phosphate-dependent enzyme [Sporosarcina koreensis]|uniref:aminotransferase class I/II-fold pyridoxal phosphate-dependent enzyme n=1 Tax=Sporosarcina koreensis TaxID=334735 RepID=UPI00058AF5CA|nr:aminotransferase class I/II-fold pyridoxal phosphate-dependent enzyme [Sporosarcina koreensis]
MDQQKRPIVEALEAFQAADPVSFHVPGHKTGRLSGLPDGLRAAMRYDATELTGLDDLHAPIGAIREAEELLADAYGADRSFLLVNGSTAGNLAMVRAVCTPGDVLLVQRNAHKSVFHAVELAGAQAVFLNPEWDGMTCTAGAVSVDTVREALDRHPEAKGIFVTYPTYYGTAGETLSDIISCAHGHGIPVLADEAHGAHLLAGPPFPPSALALGADAVVQSAHKTLSAMTQGSFLHVNSSLVDADRIARGLSMLQTSSPSYVLLASLDDARARIAAYSEADKHAFLEWRRQFIDRCRKLAKLDIIEPDDPLKVLVRHKHVSGYALQQALEQQGIYTELADERQVLFILPLLTEGADYPAERVASALAKAIRTLESEDEEKKPEPGPALPADRPAIRISGGPAGSPSEWVPVDEAAGRSAAGAIIPYPPGIPLILEDEPLSGETIDTVCRMAASGAAFQGAVRTSDGRVEFEVKTEQGGDGNG